MALGEDPRLKRGWQLLEQQEIDGAPGRLAEPVGERDPVSVREPFDHEIDIAPRPEPAPRERADEPGASEAELAT